MKTIVPAKKPQLNKDEAMKLLLSFDLKQYSLILLGIRGYYKKTMGDPSCNDRCLYDDALFIISPMTFKAFNANTDPSVERKGIAVLKGGNVYLYKLGVHGISGPHPYEALRQYGNVTVTRDGEGEFTDTPSQRFWIDIHRGGYNTTSSLGCQTIYPTQWDEFINTVKHQLEKFDQTIVPYVLVEV